VYTNTAGGCNSGKAVSHTAKPPLPRGHCLANGVKDMNPQRQIHTNTLAARTISWNTKTHKYTRRGNRQLFW